MMALTDDGGVYFWTTYAPEEVWQAQHGRQKYDNSDTQGAAANIGEHYMHGLRAVCLMLHQKHALFRESIWEGGIRRASVCSFS